MAAFLIIGLHSCVDHMFDEPPGYVPEVIETNGSVGDLLDRWVPESYTLIEDDLIIGGRVVANDESGNFYKQLVIQDETGGIQVRLDAIGLFNEYPIGRKVALKCKGLTISDYNGLPQLSATEGSGSSITSIAIPEPLISDYLFNTVDTEDVGPTVLKISQVSPEMVNTLVKFEDVQFAVSSVSEPLADVVNKFSRNLDVEDCNENVILVRTSGYASFANEFSPSGKGSIEGILSVFRDDYQILLRDFSGIQMDGERCGDGGTGNGGDPVESIDENFQSLNDNQNVSLDGWANIAVKGSRLWRAKEFDNNVYVQATAYNDSADEMEAWLITPKVKFDAPMKMTLRSAIAFHKHDGLKVFYSSDFDGSNVQNATWNELELTLAGSGQDNYDWVESGEIDLSEITGEAYIGFQYTGNPVNETTSFIIDDVKIVDQ